MIPLSVRANLMLVDKGVRPAMLIQPQDYNEEKDGRITMNILSFIHKTYPDLHCSDTYSIYQGIIVSKQKYTSHISLDKMGEILGYFCEFRAEATYSISAILYGKERCVLFTNTCMTLKERPKFEAFARRANEVLTSLGEVRIEYTHHVPVDEVIAKFIKKKRLQDEDFLSINRNLASLFCSEDTPDICDEF